MRPGFGASCGVCNDRRCWRSHECTYPLKKLVDRVALCMFNEIEASFDKSARRNIEKSRTKQTIPGDHCSGDGVPAIPG